MSENILAGIQIFISIILIIAILLQQRGSGVGSLFGGASSGGGEYYRTRRGLENFLFYTTIIMGVFLVITSFAFLFV